MEQMHSLLKRQIRRHFGDQFRIPNEWQGFIDAVNSAYQEFDMDRGMLERSLDLSSQELIEANTEVQAIFLAIPDLLFRIDGEGRILNYKAGATTDLLLNPKDVLGKRIQDVPLKQVSEKFSEAIRQVLESKTIISTEYSLSIQNQHLFFEARLVPLPENQIGVIIRNITERMRVEKALQESEKKFRAIINGMVDTVWVIGPFADIIDVNNAAVEVMGYSREELLSMKIADIDDHQKPEEIKELTGKMPMDKIQTFETWHKKKNGKEIPVEINTSIITYGDKNVLLCIARDITERKRTEEALRASELRFKTLTETAPVGIFGTDVNGVTTYVNPRWCEISKMNYDEALGNGWLNAVHPDDRAQLAEGWQRAASVQTTSKAEYRFLHANGSIACVEGLAVPQKDDNGNVVGYIGTIMDITERKQVEEALELAATRFKLVTLATRDAIFDWDMNKHQIWRNENYQQLFGAKEWSNDAADWWEDRIHPEDRESVLHMHNTALKSNAHIISMEYRFRRSDGSYAFVFDRSHIVRDSDGHAIRMIGAITDITERKQAEESLKRERNLFRVLIDNLPDAIYVKDTECRKTIANVADVRNMGRQSEAEVLGKTDLELYPADIAAGFYTDDLSVIKEGKSVINKEEFLFDKDGKKNWLLTFKIPMRDEQGRIIGLVGIGRDITEQKRVMETLTLLSHTLKSIGESISITDLKNNILFVNEAFLITYGYTEQELIGKSIDIVSRDPYIHEQAILVETIKGGWQGELLNRKKDGTLFPIYLSTSIVYDEKEQPIGLVGVATDITERKRAEEELQNERNLLRAVIDNLPDLFQFKDAKGRYLLNNRAHLKSIGMKSQEDTLGKTAFDFHLPELAKQYYEDEMKIIDTGEPLIDKEELVIHQEMNESRWHLTSKVPLKDSQGKVTGLIVITRDITERKRAEKALQESQALYRSFIENLPASVFRKDSEGRYVFVNSLFCKFKGLKMDEVVGKTPLELEAFVSKVKATRPSIMTAEQGILAHEGTAHHDMIMRTGKPMEVEEIFPQPDGTTKYFYVLKSPIFSSDGKIIGTQGVQFDITDRKRAEEALQNERNLLRIIIENLPDGVYTKDMNCQKTLANRTDVVNMGYKSEADVLGKDDFELFPKEMAEKFIADDRSVIQTGQPVIDREEYVIDAQGQKHFLLTTKLPFRNEQGQMIGLIGIGHDVTERKLAEEALRERDEKLRNIVEHSTNLFFSRNTDQVFTYLSPQTRDIFDCEPDEALVPFTDFMTDNPINKLGCDLAKKAVQTGARQETYELELLSRKGRRVWVEIQEAPVVKDGKTISIVGAATDITERRWAEMALQVSEKKYRDIVTWAPIGIYQTTYSGKLLTANKSVVEMLGYEDVSELIGCDIGKDIYYDEKDRERLIIRHETYGENITLSAETRWKKKNGSIIWVLMTVHDVRDKSSEILYYEGFVFDITERKHSEEALRESEERYRLLVENSTDIVTEISAENKFLYVSPNVKSILDYKPLDLVGTNVLSKVYGKDKAIIGEILSKLGGSATYRYRDRLGGWHWFESSGQVYNTSSGEQRMVMVSRDITQRRKAEQELELSRKQLQHFTEHLEHILEEERKRISRELHDELGQLLTILKFDLSWLKLEGAKSGSDIIPKLDGMMDTVNEALASVKRISREIRPPQLDALGIGGAIQWDIEQVEKKTGLKGTVTVELADVEIKSQISTVLYRVFREALTNILRHAQAKQVFVQLTQRLSSVNLTIRDDGHGITKKELKGTTSLGLVGIRERVRMVGGTLSIVGKPGRGTILSVEIPLKKKIGDSKS